MNAIENHGFKLNLGWWNQRIAHLPGSPVVGTNGETDEGLIDRGRLFSMAADARDDESGRSAFRLLWHSLAWGTGSNHRNTTRRIHSVEKKPDKIGCLLQKAAKLSITDPEQAFLTFQPRANAIGSLGPNFFTKYLYFAGEGHLSHPCLIVDNRVLATLHHYTPWPVFTPNSTNYTFSTYEAALYVMGAWAKELSMATRTVGADEVERWAFQFRS
ncbi:hypothetical protein [Arthrobacter sp. ISL-28]|uniref:8-oxoguanine DNA glycosylase OGG fold protein n=1 Tax=Arthrobacter sp. ISL-28 TaxID=2819108 RepID=UPI001BE9208E|nr:hypothetical protein [Arthrobacter sp. ISL-28]MBT2522759.1 hypothetical protein [Arthrobacter sp. ISL-28]